MSAATAAQHSGVITADALYTLDEVKARLGLGVHAMRMARRAGLKVRYVGRKAFVSGRELITHIETNGKQER